MLPLLGTKSTSFLPLEFSTCMILSMAYMIAIHIYEVTNKTIFTSEKTLNGQQDSADIVQGGPLLFEDIQTDVPTLVNIWVVAWGVKLYSRGLVRVTTWKLKGQFVG